MIEYAKTWLSLKTDKRAVTALEYGLIAALIAVVIIASVTALGKELQAVFQHIITGITPAASSAGSS